MASVITSTPDNRIEQIMFSQPSVTVGDARPTLALAHIVFTRHSRYGSTALDDSLQLIEDLNPVQIYLHLPTSPAGSPVYTAPCIPSSPRCNNDLRSVRVSLDGVAPEHIRSHLPAVVAFGLGLLAGGCDLGHTTRTGGSGPGDIAKFRVSSADWDAASLVVDVVSNWFDHVHSANCALTSPLSPQFADVLAQEPRSAAVAIELRLSADASNSALEPSTRAAQILRPLVPELMIACQALDQEVRGGFTIARGERLLARLHTGTFNIETEDRS